MDPLVFLALVVIIAAVAALVSAPLRRSRGNEDPGAEARAELEAARDAKYREIRDAQLDHRTGKLSDEDYQALEASLRAEAAEILRRLDATGEYP